MLGKAYLNKLFIFSNWNGKKGKYAHPHAVQPPTPTPTELPGRMETFKSAELNAISRL